MQEAITTQIHDFNGRLDIFVANAGVPWTKGPMLDADNNQYRKVVSIDLDGTYYCAKYAGQHWRRQKKEGTTIDGKPLEGFSYGSFIATASMSAHIVNIPQLQAAYNAAKAGIIHLGGLYLILWPSPLSPANSHGLQSSPLRLSGCNSLERTLYRQDTWQQRSRILFPLKPKVSGRTRFPWDAKAKFTNSKAYTCFWPPTHQATPLAPISSATADIACREPHDRFPR